MRARQAAVLPVAAAFAGAAGCPGLLEIRLHRAPRLFRQIAGARSSAAPARVSGRATPADPV